MGETLSIKSVTWSITEEVIEHKMDIGGGSLCEYLIRICTYGS